MHWEIGFMLERILSPEYRALMHELIRLFV